MPSLRTFRVEFDRPGATYMVGETVSGNIIVDVAREKSVRGLFFSTKGEARVHWTESKSTKGIGARNTARIEHYTNSEEYYHFKYNIVGTQKSDTRVNIPVGVHKYPFKFQLPYNIPSSFEHAHGHVRYTVKAVIDRPWKFDHQCKSAFTVVSSLDLNAYPQNCLGIDDEVTENFCCFCCIDRGSLNLRINMPISGYVPGQSINTTMDYVNRSSGVRVTKIYTKLIQGLKFHSSSPSRKMKTVASEITSAKNTGPFPSRGQVMTSLLIPPVPPSNLEYCSIIDLDYKVINFVHVSGPHCTIQKRYPVLIGTVPLYIPPSAPPMDETKPVRAFSSTEKEKEPATMAVPMPMPMPVQPTVPYSTVDDQSDGFHQPKVHPVGLVDPGQPSNSSNNWNIPPPSYEECVSGAENIKDHDESNYVFGANDPFAPRYPVFNYPVPGMRDK